MCSLFEQTLLYSFPAAFGSLVTNFCNSSSRTPSSPRVIAWASLSTSAVCSRGFFRLDSIVRATVGRSDLIWRTASLLRDPDSPAYSEKTAETYPLLTIIGPSEGLIKQNFISCTNASSSLSSAKVFCRFKKNAGVTHSTIASSKLASGHSSLPEAKTAAASRSSRRVFCSRTSEAVVITTSIIESLVE